MKGMIDIRYLDKINSPQDLKRLRVKELEVLTGEIRQFLVDSISKTGGHLASNLGVAELSVALHYCFNSPVDKIIFDVGHQAYTHKILTGRKEQFNTLRQAGGLSGFPKPEESEHDVFGVGHSSTAISAALGMAKSRDILGENHRVVAVVGDGAMTGGMSFEGLNDAGSGQSDLLVILNDNQMSISKNVGAMSRYLNDIRTTRSYIGAKSGVRNLLGKLPAIGGPLGRFIKRVKKFLRYTLLRGALFEEMGFRYIGPIDGNNLKELIQVLTNIKHIKGPVLLHVCTKKGKGYSHAEAVPSAFHGVEPFDVETGKPLNGAVCGETFTQVFGKGIVDLAENDGRIVAVSAAMPQGTGLDRFASRFPNRFFDVGIAESHAVTLAAGMAVSGLRPVVAIYSTFLQRAYDQILHDVCLQNLPVIFAIDRAGIVGADGETHQGVFDLSFLSHIPNLTIMAPKDGAELEAMLAFAVELGTPVAIRYPRDMTAACRSVPSHQATLDCRVAVQCAFVGGAETLAEGEKICIASVGSMAETAAVVRQRLADDGFLPVHINARFIKPLDGAMLQRLREFDYVYTLEDNALAGGFGAAVMTALNSTSSGTKIKLFAFPDEFIKQGTRGEIFKQYGLDADGIYAAITAHMKEEAKYEG